MFGDLLDLDESQRAAELSLLRATRPDLYDRVQAFLNADRDASRQAFLDSAPPIAWCERSPGDRAGAYRLERQLGEGGMGEVWLARRADGLFEQPVALKLLHAHLAHSAARERFVREGRILGELRHAHIAQLLDAGMLADGQLYLAIEYVDGERLDAWCDRERLGLRERLQLFLQVCAAVAHAHAHLVVHRDLKPSNILVTPNGTVKLLDFGIAKLVEIDHGRADETELTRLGGRVMTPEYAAPEQILGTPVTVAADIYSLGMLLYQLLGGRRPYGKPGDPLSVLERAVIEAEPDAPSAMRTRRQQRTLTLLQSDADSIAAARSTTPRALSRSLRGDLDTIVLKTLRKRPEERYVSALAFAEDIERYLRHEPVLAQPDSWRYRTLKYLRRNRLEVALVSSLGLGLIVSLVLFVQARSARLLAERETAQAVALSDFLQWDLLLSINDDRSDLRRLTANKELLDASAGRIGERLAAQPLAAAKLRGSFASAYGKLGYYNESYHLQVENLELAKRAIDENWPDALDIAAESGGRFKERDAEYQFRLEKLARKRLPARDLRRLSIQNNAAWLLARRGRYAEAQTMFEDFARGIEAADLTQGDYRELWVYGLDEYGEFFQQRGDQTRALSIFRRVLEQQLEDPAAGNSGIGWTRAWIALSLIAIGDLEAAETELQTILDEASKTHTDFSFLPVAARIDLGLVRCMQGRFDEARALSEPAFAQIDPHAAVDSPGRALPREWMAQQALIEGDGVRAETDLRQALAIHAPAVPEDSIALARDHVRLADALRLQGRLDEAERELAAVPEITMPRLLDNPLDVIELRRVGGLLARDRGQLDLARQRLDEALTTSREINGERSFWTIRLERERAALG